MPLPLLEAYVGDDDALLRDYKVYALRLALTQYMHGHVPKNTPMNAGLEEDVPPGADGKNRYINILPGLGWSYWTKTL